MTGIFYLSNKTLSMHPGAINRTALVEPMLMCR